LTKCALAWWDGKQLITGEYTSLPRIIGDWKADAIIVEQPVPQGGLRSGCASTFELVRVADRIAQAALRAGLTVYAVPVQVIREQAGIARNQKGQDAAVKDYLFWWLRASGHKNIAVSAFRKNGPLSNADKRDSAMCALFNWRAAQNQIWKVTR